MSKTSRRTVLLALLAAGSFVYSAIVHFDIPASLMLSFFVKSLIFLAVALGIAACFVGLITLARKLKQ